jgi:hypothetical protein
MPQKLEHYVWIHKQRRKMYEVMIAPKFPGKQTPKKSSWSVAINIVRVYLKLKSVM